MNAYVYLAIFAAVFAVLSTYIKAKGVQIFLLLCAGNVLSTAFAETLTGEIKNTVDTGSAPLTTIVRGSLLLLPPVLGLLVSYGSVKKKRFLLHVIPAIATAILGYLWFMKVLPADQYDMLRDANVTRELLRFDDGVLVAGILSALALLWVERPKAGDDGKKKKH